MKHFKLVLLALVAGFALSCSSDDNGSNGTSDDMYVNFKLNGELVELIEPATTSSLASVISASEGEGNTLKYIALWMPNEPTLGSHAITLASPSDLDAYTANMEIGNDVFFDAESGTLTVTSIDAEYIEGTFSFTGEHEGTTYTVTEGEFRAYKPENP
jgi:hypothetical protein